MTVWIALAVGILIGWLIEWIVDWLFWRRNLAASFAIETQLRNELAATEAQLAELTAANHALQQELEGAHSVQIVTVPDVPEAVDDEPELIEPEGTETVDSEAVIVESDRTNAGSTARASVDADGVEVAGAEPDPDSDHAVEVDATEAIASAAVPMSSAPTPQADDLIRIDGIGPVYRRKLHEAGIYTFAQLAAASPQQVTAAVNPGGSPKSAYEQWIIEAAKLADAAQGIGNDSADSVDNGKDGESSQE